MLLRETLKWRSPLDYLHAAHASGSDYMLLYSGMRTRFTGRYSILALYPRQVIESEDFGAFAEVLSTDQPAFTNAWLGYLGYGLKNAVEKLAEDEPSHIDLPNLRMTQYATVLVFDYEEETITVHRTADAPAIPSPVAPVESGFHIASLASDFTKAEYLAHVETIREAIHQGQLYQANLTRKFHGTFTESPSPAAIFNELVNVSPAPYSALIRFGDTAIISSSPEQFLHLEADGCVETRPIKGSARRSEDPTEDARIRADLADSTKDRAENLMIVDLMRNDLARSCEVGSVKTAALYDITTYATVHHMSSTINAQRRADVSPLELVARCFPPGSMTGAPKISAMELCSALEPRGRGVYSGAIGWFGGDGSVDLNVVIRTLVVQGNRFEFQVGGAIVHDSTAEGEWEETLVKARGLAKALGIDEEYLRAL